jgi:hypothetical protein
METASLKCNAESSWLTEFVLIVDHIHIMGMTNKVMVSGIIVPYKVLLVR